MITIACALTGACYYSDTASDYYVDEIYTHPSTSHVRISDRHPQPEVVYIEDNSKHHPSKHHHHYKKKNEHHSKAPESEKHHVTNSDNKEGSSSATHEKKKHRMPMVGSKPLEVEKVYPQTPKEQQPEHNEPTTAEQ